MHKHAASLPSLSVRIDLAMDGRIGPGKIQLLEAIASCGSISAAGRAMDMSYKRAWDLVDEINRICGRAVDSQTGGKNGGGAVLTPFGVTGRSSVPQQALCAKTFWHCKLISGIVGSLAQVKALRFKKLDCPNQLCKVRSVI